MTYSAPKVYCISTHSEYCPEVVIAQFFEEGEQPLDTASPRVWPLIHEFCEIGFAHWPELEQPLAYEVESFTLAIDTLEELGSVLAR